MSQLTFDELKRRLTAATPSGVLHLGPTTLDSPDLTRLFRDWLPGGSLDLTVSERNDADNVVVIAGTMDWPVAAKPAEVTATFNIGADSSAQARFRVTPGAAWRLRDAATDLTGTALDAVALGDSTVVFGSAGYVPAGEGLPGALSLTGDFALAALTDPPWSWLRPLLPEGPTLHLEGSIDRSGGATAVALDSNPFRFATDSAFRTQATLELVAGPGESGGVAADIVLRLDIGQNPEKVTVTGSLPLDSSRLFLTISPSTALESITAVAGLLPGPLQTLLDQLPGPALFEKAQLQLDHVLLVIDLARPHVDLITVGVGGARDWDLLDNGKLVLGGVELLLLLGEPFSSSPLPFGALTGTITFGGVPFDVETTTDKTVVARLEDGHELDVSALIDAFFPAIPADLPAISALEIRVGPGKAYSLAATIAGPWAIPAGSGGLSIGPVFLHIETTDPSGAGSPTGSIEAWADLFDVTLYLSDQLGGPLELSATLPSLPLGAVLQQFVPSFIPMPDALPKLTLDDASIDFVKDGASYRVDVATDVKSGATDFGTVELLAQHVGSEWEGALGFQLPDDWRISALSQTLAGFDSLRLSGTGLVLSSFDGDPGFRRITVPLDNGRVHRGIRLASSLSLVDGQVGGVSMAWVQRHLFGARVNHATLSADLAADLMAGDIAAAVEGAFPLGSLPVVFRGVTLMLGWRSAEVYVSVSATFDVQAHDDTLHFTVSITLDENGGYGAATMQGTWHDAFAIKGFDLSNVALVLGIDVEGIPTLGIAGQVDVPGFDGSLALFFDSTSGSSVLAGSFSDISLEQIASLFLPPGTTAAMPKTVAESGFRGVPIAKPLPAGVAAQLDKAVGQVAADDQLLSALRQCLPDLRGPCTVACPAPAPTPRTWFVTDHTLVRTWQIRAGGASLAVSTETQLYLAGPGEVKVGELDMPAGFRLAGQLRIGDVAFTLILDGEPAPGGGFFAEANASDALSWEGVLLIARGKYVSKDTAHAAAKGPFLSLATFDATSRGAQIAGPHFILSGQVELFGVAGGDVDLTIDDHGFSGHVDGHVGEKSEGGSFSVDVRFASPLDFTAGGTLHVAIHAPIPEVRVPGTTLVLVPAFAVDSGMDATIRVTMANNAFTLEYGGSFVWQGRKVAVPATTETVTAQDVQALAGFAARFAAHIVAEAGQVFHFLVADAESWVNAMRRYFGGRVAHAEQILRKQFGRNANQIAGLLQQLGYKALDVFRAVASEFGEVAAVAALASPIGLGMTAVQIAKLLAPIYPDPVKLGTLLYDALALTYAQLWKALQAAFDLSIGQLIKILRQIL